MSDIIVNDPQVTLNDELLAIVANSVSYTTGDGERSVKAAGTGGGKGVLTISENVETKISTAKFSVFTTVDNADTVEQAIKRLSNNVLVIAGTDPFGNSLRKTFTNSVIMNNPEFNLQADGQVDVEIASDPVV
jgi:hypothetical protein